MKCDTTPGIHVIVRRQYEPPDSYKQLAIGNGKIQQATTVGDIVAEGFIEEGSKIDFTPEEIDQAIAQLQVLKERL